MTEGRDQKTRHNPPCSHEQRCNDCTDGYVDVPEAYQRLGYSGLFSIEVPIKAGQENEMRKKVPLLMKTPGWLCVAVTEDSKAVLVRCDNYAIVDIMMRIRILPRRTL